MRRTALLAAALLASTAPALAGDPGGEARAWLAGGSAAGFAAGAAWLFIAGDSLGAGDPAALLIGAGSVAVGGAGLGAAAAALSDTEAPAGPRLRPPLGALGIAGGPTLYEGEARPLTGSLAATPRARAGRFDLSLRADASRTLGTNADRDWRPGGFTGLALQSSTTALDLRPEIRMYPGDGPGSGGWGQLELALRPSVWLRAEQLTYATGEERALRRTAWLPATAGFRWHLSGRQRFELYIGPRFDQLAWTGDEAGAVPPTLGPLYFDTAYDLHVPHPAELLGHDALHRFEVGYEHSNFDGTGFNTGAAIGFAGPYRASWDVRLTRPERSWALQLGLATEIGEHGETRLTVGLVPAGEAG